MKIFQILFLESKKDFEYFINFIFNKFNEIKNFTYIKKLFYMLLLLSAILIIYIFIYVIFYITKYIFKYFFIIFDFILDNILIIQYYNNTQFILWYFSIYISLKFIITQFFEFLPKILNQFFELCYNFFYIKYYSLNFFKLIKKIIDKKLYKFYINLEYIFKFSYVYQWKAHINMRYIPKYKKYKKILILIFLEKTIQLRKKLFIYYLLLKNIKRKIFWLYIKEIYLDLIFTSINIYLYFIFWLTPIYWYINIKYYIIYRYTIYIYNKEEIKPLKKIYIKFFLLCILFILLYIFYYISLYLYFFIFWVFKYIFEYTISLIIYKIKLQFHNWNYFIKLTIYEALQLILDLEFQYETLFLFVYMHAFYDINISYDLIYNTIKGYYKYFYFNKFHYKLYYYLSYKCLTYKIK